MNFLGVGSNLDLSTMLTQLVQVASEPKVQQLGAKEVEAKNAISGLGSLSSLLSDFKTASDALKETSAFNQRTATVTQPSSGEVISVTADDTAVAGNYDIEVKDLAYGTKGYSAQINTDHTAALGLADTLTFSVADGSKTSFAINVTSGMSLNDIRDAINDDSNNFGVQVNVVDGQLVYDSSVSGAAASKQLKVEAATDARFNLEIDAVGTALQGTVIQSAQQAEITIDGISVKSDSNSFDTQISGIKITAKKETGTGEVADLNVALDTSSVKTKIETFADSYNKLRAGMNELKGSVDDEGNFTAGLLTGDPIIRNLESVLGGLLTGQAEGAASGFDTFYAVGLDIESDGTLKVDSSRLDTALSSNFDNFDELFAGTNGLATQVSTQVDSYLGFTGVIKGKEDSYNDIIDDLEDQYEAHARYIEGYQETLRKQFVALDTSIAQMNATMSYIGPQLAALSGISYASSSQS
ncbi:MAG: hypothetical protein CMI12_08175 [Oceanospirillum sp.]|nr:hypothetical protein [Oceanospirillum sp.]